MGEIVYEIIRAAVNLARNDGVRSLDTLKRMLMEQYPSRDAEVGEALRYWANYAALNR